MCWSYEVQTFRFSLDIITNTMVCQVICCVVRFSIVQIFRIHLGLLQTLENEPICFHQVTQEIAYQ